MAGIDATLNLACLVLWLNWRSVPLTKAAAISLAAAAKKTDLRRGARWFSLAAVVGILAARSLFYWDVGPLISWTPSLELGVVRLPFRSDYLIRALLFSVLSFGLTLGTFYACLLLLSVVNRRVGNDEAIQRFVRVHLGRAERWPLLIKLVAPLLVAAGAWLLGSRGLVRLGILPTCPSATGLWEQALVVGLVSYFTWEILVLALCVLYLVESYLYLGESWFWSYVHITGANLLWPLRRLPVVVGRLDFAPLLGIGLVLGIGHVVGQWLLRAFQHIPW